MSRPPIRIGSIVISVANLPAQVDFWCHALDYVPREPPTSTYAMLCPRAGQGPNLALERRSSTTSEPPRLHLDLYAQDQGAEVERLIALGATPHDERDRPADADYVMLRDPDGNRFCVVDARGR